MNDKKPALIGLDGKPLKSIYQAVKKNNFRNSGYSNAAASLTKPVFKGWEWGGGSPDDDIVAHLPIIRQRSRQLTMESPVIAGLYKTLVTNCVGDGLKPEPTPDADFLGWTADDVKRFKSKVMPLWRTFAESPHCDVYRRDNFYELTRLVCRAQDESGDAFVTLPMFERRNIPFNLRIQVVEADCVANPSGYDQAKYEVQGSDVYGGVEISKYGHVLAYWFFTGHPLSHRRPIKQIYDSNLKNRWVRVPAYGEETGRQNVLHLMESIRPGQRRGLPLISPIVELALTLDRYMKAEAIAAQIQALFALVITSDTPEAIAANLDQFAMELDESLADDIKEQLRMSYSRDDVILGSGIVQYARPGEKIEPVNPSRPTSAFEPFINSVLQMCGPALGLPYELLMQKFDASYSASRAAMNMAHSNMKVKRSQLINDFCQPVYESFIDECVARGWLEAKGYWDSPIVRRAYTNAKWNGPGLLQIDLVKEIVAAEMRVKSGVSTYSEVTSELTGGDWSENIRVREREIEMAKEAGMPPPDTPASVQTDTKNHQISAELLNYALRD